MSASIPPTRYTHDESRWPVVRCIVPKEAPDPLSLEEHLRFIDELLSRRRPFVLLIDTRGGAALDAPARDRIRQHRKARFALYERYVRGFAVVTESSLQRALMTAILAVAPGPNPEKMFDNLADALRWAHECMAASPSAENEASAAAR